MWNILKTADDRAKRTKFGTRDPTMHICSVLLIPNNAHTYMRRTFDARWLEFGLGSFGELCKISDSTIFETLLLQQFSSEFNQTS